MNNEINKILEFKENADYKKLSCDEIAILRDYITNLQQRIDQYENPDDLTLFYMWLDEKAKDKMKQLQQELEEYKDTETYSKRFLYKANKDRLNANLELVKENERLKTKTKEQSLLLIDYQDMEQKLEDYKSRIEKAVEYIEKSKEINYKTIDTLSEEVKLLKGILNGENVMLNNILNILNGRSDE